jgi:ATP-binding cassette subfamily B (MDR/TAP) protein 7
MSLMSLCTARAVSRFAPLGTVRWYRSASVQPVSNSKLASSVPAMGPVVRSLSRFLWPDNSAYRFRVVGAASSLVLAKLATVQVPILLGHLVDTLGVAATAPAAAPLYLVAAYGGSKMAASGFSELRTVLFSRVSQHACRDVARQTFSHLHSLDLSTMATTRGGELQAIISRAVKSVTSILNMMLFNVIPTLCEFGFVLFVIGSVPVVGPTVAAITAATVGAYSVFTTKVTQVRTQYRKDMNIAEQQAAAQLVDSVSNAEAVRAFANEEFETRKYDQFLAKYESANIRIMNSLGFLNFGQQSIFSLGLIGAMAVTANAVTAGLVPVGDLVMISGLLFQLSVPLNFLGGVYRETKLNLVDYGRMLEITNMKPSIRSPEPGSDGVPVLQVSDGTISLKNVSVSVRDGGKSKKLLDDVSIEIPPKYTLGIVGASGSGKTTLLRLINRLIDPESGSVSIDDQPLKSVNLQSLRRAVGIVPQDCILFNDTIGENIRYGRPDATDEEVEAAAKAAFIHEPIMKMTNGYKTVVGERGQKLSGGERQRIGIARCLLKNSRIVLFDEATSALDTSTEQKVLGAFRALKEGRTAVVVAHRLTTVMDADEIVVLDSGKIVERGTHYELLEKENGKYRTLWETQFRNATTANSS